MGYLSKVNFFREVLPKAAILAALVGLLTVLEKCGVIHRW